MTYYVARLSFLKSKQKGAIVREVQPLFSISDFIDLYGLIDTLRDVHNLQSQYMRNNFRSETNHLLEIFMGTNEQLKILQKFLVREFNAFIKGPSLLDNEDFVAFFLKPMPKDIATIEHSNKVEFVNRLLLEASYSEYIFKLNDYRSNPIVLAERLLLQNPDYRAPRAKKHIKRGYADLYLRGFINDKHGKLLALKIGRRKDVNINLLPDREDDFGTTEVENYPNIIIIWFREQQIIFVERNPQVFANFEVILRSLEDHLTNTLREYNLSVSIEPLSDFAKFWDYIKTFSNIYEIEFNLITPNFFGAGMQAREILNSAKTNYDAKEVKMGISNEDGNLRVDQDDENASQLVSWVGKGGGEWKMTGKRGEKKITVRGTDGAKMVRLELEGYDADSAAQFLKQVMPELADSD
jgi:hypothetical protein